MKKYIVAPLFLLAFSGVGRSESLLSLDLGKASVIERRSNGPQGDRVVLHQPGHDITTSIDPGTPFSVWSVEDHGRPGASVAIRIDPEQRPPEVSQKSKFEINVVRQDDQAADAAHAGHYVLKNGSSNYIGFAIKLDRTFYDAPKRWVLHFQVWQCCSLRTLPPLVLQAIPDPGLAQNTVSFAMIARNDDFIADKPRSDFGEHLRFTDGTQALHLERDRWYSMVLFLKPDPGTRVDGRMHSSAGTIGLWLDGLEVLHHVGAWGYTPDSGADVRETYAVKLGIYRAAQPTRQQVYFNGIRWGTDRVSVDPDAPR